MTAAGDGVSLVWLMTSACTLGDAWSAVQASCSATAEAILVGPPDLQAALESLPCAGPQQHVVLRQPGESAAVALNRAASQARCPFLLFITCALSPSEPCWIRPLLELLDADESAGIATPLLTGDDGRLVAAGSVAWADGTCQPFGAGSTPGRREHDFLRQVPVVAPHCFMVRSDSFHAVGGFHSGYRSLLYAAADLCFSLRARGLASLYQPRACAHVAAALENDSEALAADLLQFATRWEADLPAFPPRPSEIVSSREWLSARDAISDERILVVDDRVPAPDRGSGDPRMFAMLRELLALWPRVRVTLAAMTDLDAERSAPRLLENGIEIVYGEHWPSWFRQRRLHYGIVLMSRPQPPAVDEWIRSTQPQAFRIYDAEALTYRRLERMLPLVDSTRRAELVQQIRDVRQRELRYFEDADEIFCVSHDEARVARAVARPGTAVCVLPFCVDPADTPPGFAKRRGLVYFGGFLAGPGSPNEDAVLYLANEVLPLVRKQVPDAVLYVVGADPTPAVLALESENIHIEGYVPDPRAWLDRVRVHVVTMRFGAGVKQKMIDTMAAGLPFVTTPVGAEGLRLGGLARLILANSPQELAELTASLYLDAERWRLVQHRILGLARRHSRQQFRRALAKAMSHAGLPPPVEIAPGDPIIAAAR